MTNGWVLHNGLLHSRCNSRPTRQPKLAETEIYTLAATF